MLPHKCTKVILSLILLLFVSGFLHAQQRKQVDTSKRLGKNQLYYQHIDDYKLRLMEARKQRKKQLLSQRYGKYMDNQKNRQKRAGEVRKLQAQPTTQEQEKTVKNQEKQQAQQARRLAGQQRIQRNKEILEGKRDPIVQDDPNYLRYIQQKTQLTR